MPSRTLIIGYRLYRISILLEHLPYVGRPLALKLRHSKPCAEYVLWSWGID